MGWPLIGMGVAAVVAPVLAGLGWAGGKAVAAYVDPLTLYPQYDGNQLWQSGMPDINQGLAAYIYGTLDDKSFSHICEVNNQIFDAMPTNKHQVMSKRAFKHYINSQLPRLDLAQLIYCNYSGIITDTQFKDMSKRFKLVDGQIQPLADMLYAKFDLGIILNNFYRGTWEEPHTTKRVQRLLGCGEGHAKEIVSNSSYLAPPQDVIRFMVRDVYNKQVVKDMKLDEEYDENKEGFPWANAVGINRKTKIKTPEGTLERDILRDYWIAHWQLMSPQQAYEAFHRVREGRLDRFDKRIVNLEAFDWTQLATLLKMQDYTPQQRKWLAAISTRQLGRIDLRRLYDSKVIDDKELKEQYIDLGYNDTDAQYLLQWSKKTKEEKDDKEDKKRQHDNNAKLITETYASYEQGAISKSSAYSSLVSLDVDEIAASNNLNAIDIKIQRIRVKYFVQMVKDEFFHGLYDGQQCYIELVSGGVVDIRANNYVILWQRQLSRPRRLSSIDTVINWLKRGLISFADAGKRLLNLGLSDADTLLYIESTRMDIQHQINVEQAKQAKTEQQRADEAKRLEKEARAAKKTSISDLRSYSPLTKMQKWVGEGLLGIDEAVDRMRFMEIPEPDIARYVSEWIQGG
jgi:hypothetical protein